MSTIHNQIIFTWNRDVGTGKTEKKCLISTRLPLKVLICLLHKNGEIFNAFSDFSWVTKFFNVLTCFSKRSHSESFSSSSCPYWCLYIVLDCFFETLSFCIWFLRHFLSKNIFLKYLHFTIRRFFLVRRKISKRK